MLLMKRIPRSTLNLLVPNLNKIIELIPAEPEHREPPTNIMRRPTRISRPPQQLIYYKPGDSVMYHN